MSGPLRGLRANFAALEERNFRLLWLGQSGSTIGDGLSFFAIAFAVLQIGGIGDRDRDRLRGLLPAPRRIPARRRGMGRPPAAQPGHAHQRRGAGRGPGVAGHPPVQRLGRGVAHRRRRRPARRRVGLLRAGLNRPHAPGGQRRAAPTGERADGHLAQCGVRDRARAVGPARSRLEGPASRSRSMR